MKFELPPGKTGVMRVMGPMGDQKIAWDADDTSQVTKARTRFAELLSKGHRAFLMDVTGKKGKQITEFDPSAGAILMIPQMVGG
jgi:hypothetical protein